MSKQLLLLRNAEFWIISIAAICLALITFPNHYNFRTHGLDLGMFNQALNSFSNFQNPLFTQGYEGNDLPYLGDHFSLLLIVFVPLKWIFGSWTLLIVQWCVAIFSIISLRNLCKHFKLELKSRLALLILYCFSYGLIAAFGYDFHMNVIAALLLIPLCEKFILKKKISFFVLLILILFSKENMGLWMSFVGLALFLECYKDKDLRVLACIMALVSGVYFLITILWIMPYFNDGAMAESIADHYHVGGDVKSTGGFLMELLTSPQLVWDRLTNTTIDGVHHSKSTSLFFFFVAGGVLLLSRPHFLLMALPIFFQKFMSDNVIMWDVKYHYSVEFAPVIAIGALFFILKFQCAKWIPYLIWIFAVLSTYYTVREIVRKDVRTNIFSKDHYTNEISRNDFFRIAEYIPTQAVLSCSSEFSPHLSFREKVYLFPQIKNAEYIFIKKEDQIPQEVSSSFQEFRVVAETTEMILLHKIIAP